MKRRNTIILMMLSLCLAGTLMGCSNGNWQERYSEEEVYQTYVRPILGEMTQHSWDSIAGLSADAICSSIWQNEVSGQFAEYKQEGYAMDYLIPANIFEEVACRNIATYPEYLRTSGYYSEYENSYWFPSNAGCDGIKTTIYDVQENGEELAITFGNSYYESTIVVDQGQGTFNYLSCEARLTTEPSKGSEHTLSKEEIDELISKVVGRLDGSWMDPTSNSPMRFFFYTTEVLDLESYYHDKIGHYVVPADIFEQPTNDHFDLPKGYLKGCGFYEEEEDQYVFPNGFGSYPGLAKILEWHQDGSFLYVTYAICHEQMDEEDFSADVIKLTLDLHEGAFRYLSSERLMLSEEKEKQLYKEILTEEGIL